MSGIAERLAAVREEVAEAARRSGRKAEDVRLLAVSKFQPVEAVREAMAAGQRLFGENYVQEALEKQAVLPELVEAGGEWHFIGGIQNRRKAKSLAGRFALVHSLDRFEIAEALASGAGEVDVLIQVNIGDEPQKSGVAPSDLPALADRVLGLPGLRLRGLMGLPPVFDAGEAARPYFARLRELREELSRRLGLPLPELSMGMSGDFRQAVEEGATLVRLGSVLFGPRPSH